MSHDHTTSERSGEAEPTGAAPLAGDAPRDRDHDGFDATTDSGSLPVVAEAIEPVGGTSAVALVDRPDPSPDEGGAIGAAESVAALGAGDVLGPTPGDAALDAGPTIVARPPYPPPPPPVPLVPADGTPEAEAAPDDSKPEAKAAPDDSTAESKATPDGNTPESKAAPDPAPAVTTATLATTPTTSTAEASALPGPTTTTTSPPAAVAPARTRAAAGKLGYLPALDGLRAVAVLLVIGYHLGYSGLAGGFIGVEVFFVLSGWLVCALLMGESRAAGRIGLGGFWLRRARRLLPAMVVVTFVTLAVATVLTPDQVADLRGDAFAALTYHLNWRLILDSQSYFAAADGPSALQHLWSLSIEEQFYLVFPLLAIVLAKRRTGVAVTIVLAMVVASTVVRFAWYDAGTDPSTIYFSTITRAAGLLAGVALGLFWIPRRLRSRPGFVASRVLDVVALGGLGVVVWYTMSVTEQDRTAFRGSFSVVQLATILAIAALVVPSRSYVGAALATAPMRWIGKRSYGIYLIHWPVIVFTSRAPGQQPEAVGKVVLQLLAIGALSAVSFKVIEEPIRRNGLAATARSAREGLRRVLSGRPIATCLVMALVIVVAGGTYATMSDVVTAKPPTESHAESVVISAAPSDAPTTTAAPATTAPAGPEATVPPAGAPTTTAPPASGYPPTTAIGDSVMVGGADALQQRMGVSLSLNAEVGRQMEGAPDILRSMADAGQLAQTVVLHLGNNGPFTAEEIDEAFSIIGPDRRVVLVTVFVPRRWEGEVNAALQAAVARHPNARLADWRAIPATTPGLLADDGYHLSNEGAQRYADVVTQAVAATG